MASTTKIDAAYWNHESIAAAGNAAAGIYVRLHSYCSHYRVTAVAQHIVDMVVGWDQAAFDALVEHGLVVPSEAGWMLVQPWAPVRKPYAVLKAQAAGYASPAAMSARIDFYGGLCWICRVAPFEAVDHVKPLSRGGSNWPANLRPACTACNSRKRDQWPFSRPVGAP